MPKSHQIAALPVRWRTADQLEVLLITSRDTGRWVIPKGWPWPKLPDHEAAAGEAWEEAGVRGTVSPHSIGGFNYEKRLESKALEVEVLVFELHVHEVAEAWPESAERRREWFAIDIAATLVDEPELKALLLAYLTKPPLGPIR